MDGWMDESKTHHYYLLLHSNISMCYKQHTVHVFVVEDT